MEIECTNEVPYWLKGECVQECPVPLTYNQKCMEPTYDYFGNYVGYICPGEIYFKHRAHICLDNLETNSVVVGVLVLAVFLVVVDFVVVLMYK